MEVDMSAEDLDHVLVPVTNLDEAEHLYAQLLEPLGYTVIGHSSHRSANGAGSQTVEFGPIGTNRVDVVISQSDYASRNNGRRSSKSEHVVFPAMSQHSVRDFYAAALDAGCAVVQAPGDDPVLGQFSTTMRDGFGNFVEVRDASQPPNPTAEPGMSPPSSSHRINHWVSDVEDHAPRSYVDEPEDMYVAHRTTSKTVYPIRTVRAPSDASSSRRTSSSHDPHSGSSTSSFEFPGAKTVVGTLLGAAAGAALAYGIVHAREDSKIREVEYKAKMEARDRVRSEARSTRAQPMPEYYALSYSKPGPAPPTRDSGYSTSSAKGRGAADQQYRAVTYPQPGYDAPPGASSPPYRDRSDRSSQSPAQKHITYDYSDPRALPAPAPATSRSASASRRSATDSSSATAKPPSRTSSTRRSSVAYTPLAGPAPPPSLPPSMGPPSIPGYAGPSASAATYPQPRGRRTAAPPLAASAVTSRRLARSRSRSEERERRGSVSRQRSASGRSESRRASSQSTASRAAYQDAVSHHSRSSSANTARRVPLPASTAGASSNYTARHAPLPASVAGSARSARTAREVALPPSESGASELTEKALSAFDRRSGYVTGSKLDELETTVSPDDSISVALGPARRKREGSAAGRSRASVRSARTVREGVVAG